MRDVSIVGIGYLPVEKATKLSLRQMGARAVQAAIEDANADRVDALFVGNMLADELQGQKHLAALIADEAGLRDIEAMEVRAATASGAACLRMAYLAVASGEAEIAVAAGVEKMSEGIPTPALSKALDVEREVRDGATLISRNADLMRLYLDRYGLKDDVLTGFSLNAHRNSRTVAHALYKKPVTARAIKTSRYISSPIRLLHCSPICDGAAALVMVPTSEARAFSPHPVKILASSAATDRFRVDDREDPTWLNAAYLSAGRAFRRANVNREDIKLFELHDAFSIMACLQLEAVGYAERGEGWTLAERGLIVPGGTIPIATMGGLKARGHPIGATAIYQACEIVLQLTGRAGKNQVRDAHLAMTQSIGGAATTVITHVMGV
jgi:acetyl-CoA C-acetyltransferase